ncbi:unnamed protein product, partial [Schistocephalus solidus]|uniref:POPLD domain-containing protein n=1 Tax=Schistocephalus solidus TaxID=70667 RepID=A0A183SB45_SCHSO
KELSESSEHGLVAAALAARSSVLSAPLPCPHVVFADSGNTIRLTCSTSADCTWLNRALAAIATSTVAAAVGNERMLPSSLPHLLANLPSGVGVEGEKRTRKKKKIKTLKPAVSLSERLDYYGGQSNSGKMGTTTSAADSWLPRPLLASRDPIDEEGTFVAFCPHVMHADCKANSTRQMNYISSVV